MDATARGFHAQLVLLAARQDGRIPDDPAQWRRWLGLPEAGAAQAWPRMPAAVMQWLSQGTPGRLVELGGAAALMEYYWVHRWEPMVRAAWQAQSPGWLTCEAARQLAGLATAQGALPAQAREAEGPAKSPAAGRGGRKPARRKAKARSPLHGLAVEQWLGPRGPVGPGWLAVVPLGDRLADRDAIQAQWHVPASRAVRLNLWTVGLAALGQGPGEEQKNRAFLSSLIQKYGERKVAAAVGEMGGRRVPPADPRAFLRAILRRESEGTVAAQRAREDRSQVPL